MKKGRLEAFSDGVLAIIITIMVLELKVPHEPTWTAIIPMLPILMSYVLGFVYVAIYWNNHHHLLHSISEVSGGILWANMHLLFWLSLIPFTTAWMGETHFAPTPLAIYGVVLLMAAISYYILQNCLLVKHGKNSLLGQALGNDIKGKLSPIFYLLAIPMSYLWSWVAIGLYILVALMWLIPDKRIEKAIYTKQQH